MSVRDQQLRKIRGNDQMSGFESSPSGKRRLGRLDVIRKEAWPFYRTIPGVRLCWELEESTGPEGRIMRKASGKFVASMLSQPAMELQAEKLRANPTTHW